MTRLNAALSALVLPVGGAVSATLSGTAKDFPLLTDLIFDMCGAVSFDFTPQSPCPYAIFGLSVAWSECGDAYESSFEGFRSCLGSCATPDFCKKVCSGHAPGMARQQCDAECGVMEACVEDALMKGTGQVSAEGSVRTCFTGAGGKAEARSQAGAAAGAAAASSFLAVRAPNKTATSDDVFKPAADYSALFPAGCELLGDGHSPWQQKLAVPKRPIGQGSPPLHVAPPAPTAPKLLGSFQAVVEAMTSATTPLPAAWHAARHGAFDKTVSKLEAVPPAVDATGDWMREAKDSVPECPSTVSVMGMEFTSHAGRMGTFKIVDTPPFVHNGGRPVYRSNNGQYLYYWDALKVWRIGDDYRSGSAGISSTGGVAAECPTGAQGWAAWVGGTWSQKQPIKVVAA